MLGKFTAQTLRLNKKLDLFISEKAFPPSMPHHHITEDLFTAVPLTWYILLYEDKITRHTRNKKLNLKRQSKPQNQTWQRYWNCKTWKLKQ